MKSFKFTPFQKDLIKNKNGAHAALSNEWFDKLERDIQRDIQRQIAEQISAHNAYMDDLRRKSKTATHVINAIHKLIKYADYKGSIGMRMKKSEFDYMMKNLDEDEVRKVMNWIDSQGGFDQVFAPERK